MFTGIVEEVGRVLSLIPKATGASLTISCSSVLADAAPGASIAINGACITAVQVTPSGFSADLSPETLARTNLGDLAAGSLVNLERPLRANGRLDGHFVLGHVDGAASVVSLDSLGDQNWWLRIRVPSGIERYIVSKGSIAVDGISLTVAELDADLVGFTIIPTTYSATALSARPPGARVNVEVDILAKHLEKLVSIHAV